MRLTQLEWFCHAYEAQSFAKAAERVYVSRQAFGKAMNMLERELGVSLFNRDTLGAHPTRIAHLVYPKAKACIKNCQTIVNTCDDCLTDQREEIHFALADGVAAALPDDFLEGLEAENPYVEFFIEKYFIIECLGLLQQGKVNFVIGTGPLRGQDMKRISLSRYDTYVAVAEDLVHFDVGNCTMDDLQALTFFVLGKEFPSNREFLELFESRGLTPHLNSQYKDYDVVIKEVQQGHGATIVPANCLNQVKGHDMVVIPFPEPSFCWEIDFFYLDPEYTATEQRVIDFMRRYSRAVPVE